MGWRRFALSKESKAQGSLPSFAVPSDKIGKMPPEDLRAELFRLVADRFGRKGHFLELPHRIDERLH
jgi:hypothetical protein